MALEYVQEFGDGWVHLVEDTLRKIESIDSHYAVFQVKEKFGSLRLYGTSSYEYGSPQSMLIDEIIDEAEKHSATVCEVCGLPGRTVSRNHWLRTVCEKHDNGGTVVEAD